MLVAVAVLLALVATACGSDGDSGDKASSGDGTTTTAATAADEGATSGPNTPAPQPLAEKTKVTIVPVVAIEPFAPAYLAKYFGEFEKENLDVTIKELPSNDTFVALARGDAQLQVGGLNAGFFNLVQGGTDVKWIANVHHQSAASKEGLWVRKKLLQDGKIDPAKLKGMKIAMGTGGISSTSALPVAKWLEQNGADLSTPELLSVGGNDIVVALEQGSVDAGYVLSPAWQTVEANGCCELVTPQPPLAASTYTMTSKFMEQDRETAKAIVRALMRTVRTYLQGDYHSDPKVVAALVDTLQVPESAIAGSPSLVFDPDMEFDSETLDEIQKIWIDADVLTFDSPMPKDKVVDTSVVDEVREGK